MKNLIGSLALAALALVLVGRPAPAAADDKEYEMKITTLAPDKTAWAKVLKEYKTNVEKAAKDKGYKIKVRVFLGGTLTDDENNSVKMTKRGQVQAVGASTGAVASLVEALEARLGCRVTIQRRGEDHGRVELHFGSAEEFERIMEILGLPSSQRL